MIVVMRGNHIRMIAGDSCAKRPYKSPAKCKKQLRTSAKARGCNSFYLCDRCGHYHLTSQKP